MGAMWQGWGWGWWVVGEYSRKKHMVPDLMELSVQKGNVLIHCYVKEMDKYKQLTNHYGAQCRE